MVITAGELAKKIGAQLIGDGSVSISKVSEIDSGADPETVVVAIDKKAVTKLKKYSPKIIILNKDIPELKATKIITNKGKDVLVDILNILYPQKQSGFISSQAIIWKDVTIGKGTSIYPGVIIGKNVTIGNNSIIYPNVVIYDNCVIGNDCIIHGNAVIGADGFGYIQKDGKNIKVQQVGNVIIEDNVEVGACTTIDRATLGSTVIGAGTKIDNQVQVGHNTKIGEDCIIVAGVRIAGSVIIEDNVVIAGNVGIVDHVTIGKGSTIFAYTLVTKSFPANSKIYGALIGDDQSAAMKRQALYNKLPEISQRLKDVERRLNES